MTSSERPLRVLVLWADNRSANLGVRVLAAGMAQLARSTWGEQTVVDFQDFGAGDSDIGFGGRAALRDLGRSRGVLKEKLRGYDLILDSGAGDSFADIYGLKRLLIMNYAHRIAARTKVSIAMGPQTIGPFKTRVGRVIAKNSLKRMSTVVARDNISASYAAGLGRDVDALSTDVVFGLPLPPRSHERDVIVNVSGLLWEPNHHVDSQMYQVDVIELCEGLLAAGRRVTLLPHVLDNPSHDNDLPAVASVQARLGGCVEVAVPTDLADARQILATGRLVIGSRMHACLNAMSVGTPAISWAYSRKFAPLMSDIGWPLGMDLNTEAHPALKTLAILDGWDEATMKTKLESVLVKSNERLAAAMNALSELNLRAGER